MGLDWKGILDFYEEAELDNWGLRRGKMMYDRYRFVVEGQVYLGELSSLTSLLPRECWLPEPRVVLDVLDSFCQQMCEIVLANAIPESPQGNNCYHFLLYLKGSRSVCST